MEICTQKQFDEKIITSLKEEVFRLWCLREISIEPIQCKGKPFVNRIEEHVQRKGNEGLQRILEKEGVLD